MLIVNQSGTAAYNLENIVSIRRQGEHIKVMLPCPIWNEDGENLPNIVIAKYSTKEKAQKEFEIYLSRMRLISGGIYQFPAEGSENEQGNGNEDCDGGS